ncbi:MAG: M48 family metalloprotease [Bacteroidales bacterium]|nr:M48 family metalloprotease [Bacteroidales bacterium]
MSILSDLLSDKVITALGWNIFHILWQGVIIALVLSVVLRFLKGKSAQIRYLISLVSLFLMLGLSIFNFTNNYDDNLSKTINTGSLYQPESSNVLLIDLNNTEINATSKEVLAKFKNRLENIDKYFPLIVNIWIIGMLIFIVKFILSYLYTNRLKKIKITSISEEWLGRFLKLQEQLKINRTVSYIESQLIKIPLVLGYLKPVIVIPVEMLSGIPSNQIEAIIAHELAHIRRNDYIFNVLQTIIETVFFFHPAVWYISSQIRNERENCCDDMALTVCDGSLVYAKALVSVQELTLGKHYAAVAFSGRKKHLLNRIKRMIMKQKVKSNFTDKIIAAIIILSGVLALSFTYKANITNYISESGLTNEIVKTIEIKSLEEIPEQKSIVVNDVQNINSVVKDTVKIRKHHHDEIDIDENTVIRTYRDDKGKKKEMKFTLTNGKVTELYVDGIEIPESEYDKYQPEIDETIADLKEAKEDIRDAMKDIEDLDIEEIRMEVEEAIKDIHIDMEEMQIEIADAMKNIKEIDVEEILKEVEMELNEIKDMDFDFDFDFSGETFHFDMEDLNLEEIREEMEKVRESIHENIDMDEIQKEMHKVQEELSKMDMEEIRAQMEENLKHFEEFDKKETINKLEEKLEELEKLELEEK